jgi:8-oxo-dGTP pyrophosphatase MutT (NUDIX family)
MLWEVLESAYSFQSPWLKVRRDHIKMPSGHELPDFYVAELNDWVNVIAVTMDGLILIEEQYRHGIKQVCYELPAGAVEPGEDPLQSAQRELVEETGYSGGEWIPYGISVPNASGCSTRCYSFLALGVERKQMLNTDPSEEIKLHLLSKSELNEMLISGLILEGVMQAPLWRYLSENL